MPFFVVPVGRLECNCYVLWDRPDEAAVIDPGAEPGRLLGELESRGLRPRLVLNTHGHFDHTGAVDALRERFGAPYAIHRGEVEILAQVPTGTRLWGLEVPAAPKPGEFLEHGQRFRLGRMEVDAIHTPGHTPGSACFYAPGMESVFTGDTLFAGSIGRTDFPGGNGRQILESIRERLLTLPPATKVYPGHGPPSTIAQEAESNPFLA